MGTTLNGNPSSDRFEYNNITDIECPDLEDLLGIREVFSHSGFTESTHVGVLSGTHCGPFLSRRLTFHHCEAQFLAWNMGPID